MADSERYYPSKYNQNLPARPDTLDWRITVGALFPSGWNAWYAHFHIPWEAVEELCEVLESCLEGYRAQRQAVPRPEADGSNRHGGSGGSEGDCDGYYGS